MKRRATFIFIRLDNEIHDVIKGFWFIKFIINNFLLLSFIIVTAIFNKIFVNHYLKIIYKISDKID